MSESNRIDEQQLLTLDDRLMIIRIVLLNAQGPLQLGNLRAENLCPIEPAIKDQRKTALVEAPRPVLHSPDGPGIALVHLGHFHGPPRSPLYERTQTVLHSRKRLGRQGSFPGWCDRRSDRARKLTYPLRQFRQYPIEVGYRIIAGQIAGSGVNRWVYQLIAGRNHALPSHVGGGLGGLMDYNVEPLSHQPFP